MNEQPSLDKSNKYACSNRRAVADVFFAIRPEYHEDQGGQKNHDLKQPTTAKTLAKSETTADNVHHACGVEVATCIGNAP